MELAHPVWISLQDYGPGFVYGEQAKQREAEQNTYSSLTPYLDTSWTCDKAVIFWSSLLHSDDHYKKIYKQISFPGLWDGAFLNSLPSLTIQFSGHENKLMELIQIMIICLNESFFLASKQPKELTSTFVIIFILHYSHILY